jgi:hypothetical protein
MRQKREPLAVAGAADGTMGVSNGSKARVGGRNRSSNQNLAQSVKTFAAAVTGDKQ